MSQQYTKGIPMDTDPLLAENSDLLVPTQAAVRSYVDNKYVTTQVAQSTADIAKLVLMGF